MKIKVVSEGKQFEAFVKFVILENNEILGISYAGSVAAARSIHASLYTRNSIQLVDNNGKVRTVQSALKGFRRVETMDEHILHHTLLPRSTSDEDYQELLNDMVKKGGELYPERIVIAPKGNAIEVAGHFIAETFGLPKTESWLKQYVNLFLNKCNKLEVITTNLVGDWSKLQAFKILPMTEKEVLEVIEKVITNGLLNPRASSVYGDGIFQEDMTTEDYLRANVSVLAQKIDVTMKPLTDGSILDKSIGKMKRIPVPVQAKVSFAMNEVLKHKLGVFSVGDMSTGKTQMSLTSAHLMHERRIESGAQFGTRVLIVSPANVLPKWAKLEIPKILKQGHYRIVLINSTGDALKYIDKVKKGATIPKNVIEFVLISTDRMKLGAQGYVLGARWDNNKHGWISPNTGKLLNKPSATEKERKTKDLAVAGWKDAVDLPKHPPTKQMIEEARKKGELLPNGLPRGYVTAWKVNVRNFEDNYDKDKSNRSIARPARKEWNETIGGSRWMIAELFQRKLKKHFHLAIFDEVHQLKAANSGRGLSLHKIMKSACKHIYLTGTLTNGASSSIKSLLWRGFAKEMISHGITHATSDEQFAQRYGVIEKTIEIDDNGITGTHTNRRNGAVRIKEKPGISPKLIADFLLDKCVFVELSDLGIPLVELQEIPKIISLEDSHMEQYKKLHSDMYNTALGLQKEIGSAAWSKFQPATINYADQPHMGANVTFDGYDDNGNKVHYGKVTAPAFPKDYLTEKEKIFLNDVKAEKINNRRCLVYTHYTGSYGTNERLKYVLENAGFKVAVLDGRISVQNRMDWINEQTKKDIDVLITNQRLVEVGLDLLDYPTIMFYQLNDDINVVRQASRRPWRISQSKLCKVIYYIVDKTTQLAQFQRLMTRRIAAMIVEGRIERSNELAKYANHMNEGAIADLSKTLSTVELTNAWVSIAQNDIDENLEIITESEFKEKLDVAFKKLVDETIALCGYVEPTIQYLNDEDDFDYDLLDEAFAMAKAKLTNTSTIQEIDSKSCTPVIPIRKKEESGQIDDFEQLSLFSELA